MLRSSSLSILRRSTAFSASLPRLAATTRHSLCTAATEKVEEKAEAPAAEPESSEPKLL